MTTLSIGDRVRLNSGGPIMTIEAELDAQHVFCAWRIGLSVYGYDFARVALTLVLDESNHS